MSEMLGNRYFIARHFDKAITYLEQALAESPSSTGIIKKLIICYIQVGQVEKAFNLFYRIVQKDPKIITNTDLYYDDCPCNELIPMWHQREKMSEEKENLYLSLGMLYLYCDLEKSIKYFNRVKNITTRPEKVLTLLKKLKELKKNNH